MADRYQIHLHSGATNTERTVEVDCMHIAVLDKTRVRVGSGKDPAGVIIDFFDEILGIDKEFLERGTRGSHWTQIYPY